MPTLTEEQIKEIADQLDCGFCSFWHRQTGKLIFFPDFDNNPFAESEFYEEELEEINNNFSDYVEIEKPQSSDSFRIMVKFAEQLDDKNELKYELIKALNRKKPFREFKFIIDNSGIYRQQWFDFKNEQLIQWVVDKFNSVTFDEDENDNA